VIYDRGGDVNAVTRKRKLDDGGTRIEPAPLYKTYFNWSEGSERRQTVTRGQSIELCPGDPEDTVTFTVVWVGNGGIKVDGRIPNENDKSICLLITFRNYRGLSCGDLNGTEKGDRLDMEGRLAPEIGRADNALVNHHAGAASSNIVWIQTIRPAAWIVSERFNTSCDTIADLAAVAPIFITRAACGYQGDGDIVYTTNGRSDGVISGMGSGRSERLPLINAEDSTPSSSPPTSSPVPPESDQGEVGWLAAGAALGAAAAGGTALGLARRKRKISDAGTLLALHECLALLRFHQESESRKAPAGASKGRPRRRLPGRWKRVLDRLHEVEAHDPSTTVRKVAGELFDQMRAIKDGNEQAPSVYAVELTVRPPEDLIRELQDIIHERAGPPAKEESEGDGPGIPGPVPTQ
jgi:hypothetical protein